MDFYGPLPDGTYLLVLICEFSRYPIVMEVKSTAGIYVIPILKEIFALFGYPKLIKTDNGPPFQGHEFMLFLEHCDITHRKITPLASS